MLGAALALLSAVSFALTVVTMRRAVLQGTVAQAMAISLPIGLLVVFSATSLAGSIADILTFSREAVLLLCAAGAIHFLFGRYCNVRATKLIGANLVGPIQELSLIVALVLAVVMLSEAVTGLRMVGIAFVVLGPALIWRGGKVSQRAATALASPASSAVKQESPESMTGFAPSYVEGYIYAALSAVAYGVSPVLVSIALRGQGLGASLAAGLISYIAATVLFLPLLLGKSTRSSVQNMAIEPAGWFAASAVFVAVSQLFRYMALAVAPVLVVAPILRLSLVFKLLFSRMINPNHELFGSNVIAGTGVSMIGVLALTLSVDAVSEWLILPYYVESFFQWRMF